MGIDITKDIGKENGYAGRTTADIYVLYKNLP